MTRLPADDEPVAPAPEGTPEAPAKPAAPVPDGTPGVPAEPAPPAPEEASQVPAKPATRKRAPREKEAPKKKYRLLIVESPAKAKTINKFIGSRYMVMASMGHVRDLPSSKLGVDLENNFAPHYIEVRDRKPVLKELKKLAAKAEAVYLATDPDREGEAIAWHLKEAMKLTDDRVRRVIFNEITRKVVKDAVDNASGAIDMKLVESQQARRILDRLVGYSLSPLLWTKVRRGLSAGRVQSVAVRIVCEREAEIAAFKPREYWTISALLGHGSSRPFEARLSQVDGKKAEMATGEEAAAIVARFSGQPFTVTGLEKKEQRRSPAPPFTTSTLQQEAAKRYRFTAKRTMMVAQTLYEGVDLGQGTREGLITYMRTDSVRVSAEAQAEAREVLARLYGPEILPEAPPVYKGRAGAQDAHEAIRPSYGAHEPDALKKHLTTDQYKLYKLVWQRFLASQSAQAQLEQTAVDITAGPAAFRATGVIVRFPGFMSLYREVREEGEEAPEEEQEGALPAGLAVDEVLRTDEIKPEQHFTQPPPRYSDASLVKALEEDGIGRPSTYAPTISTILDRGYVERKEGRFHPSDLGTLVNELLVGHFQDVINVEFTAQMEAQLDQVEEGTIDWHEAVRGFHKPFSTDLEKAKLEMRNVKAEVETVTDIMCEKCGKPMIVRWGRHGKFLACSGYPECRNAKSYEVDPAGKIVVLVPQVTDEKCDKCGSPMVIRSGRFGKFLACQKYPECRTTRPIPLDFNCPKPGCEGKLVMRRSRRGRVFYGCNKYPACDFVTWNAPVKKPCPKCGAVFLTERKLKNSSRFACVVEGCGYEAEESEIGGAGEGGGTPPAGSGPAGSGPAGSGPGGNGAGWAPPSAKASDGTPPAGTPPAGSTSGEAPPAGSTPGEAPPAAGTA
jgi:DNA topoisomerase-1